MVAAAEELKGKLKDAGTEDVQVSLTGASGMWSDFNEANRSAMMKSELISWPVTLIILMLAFGSLVAAGLPLMLTILGLVASAGTLYLGTKFFDISIWAMNFALMFALALGIDYALFIVHRFRGAFFGSKLTAREAVAVTMDTAGKAVLFSGATVLISLSAVMLVPSPAFRSMALGIMVSVVFVLLASLTLLPAVLGKLGPRVDRLALKWVHSGEHRSPAFAAWAERLWRHPWLFGTAAVAILVALSLPVLGLRTGMPSIKVVPQEDTSRQGYELVQSAFGEGAPGALQLVGPAADVDKAVAIVKADPGIARVMPAQKGAGGLVLVQAIPDSDPSSPAVGATIDRLRAAVPTGVLVGGATAENHDLEQVLSEKTPLVIGVVLVLGFLLLLLALQAPVIAAVGVLTNLLAVGAAFGVARLIFQDGHGAGLLALRVPGLHRRLGAGVLLRHDLRDLDGLHRVPALVGEGALRPHPRPARSDDRRPRTLRARHLRRRGRDGGRVLHVRALGAAAAEGDGRHPRRRRGARRAPDPAHPRSRGPAAPRYLGLGPAALARPHPPGRHVRALLSNRESKGSPMDVTTATFERDVIEKSREHPVVVDFWAAWCGPCRALAPAIESEVAKRSEQILLAKVDVDAETTIAARYGIQSIPTVAVFANGEPVTGFVGAQPAPAIGRFLDGVIADHAGPVEAA